jgi:hypothetical protein
MLRRHSRVPVSGKLPNVPSVTVPLIVFPVTVPLQLSVIVIGTMRSIFEVRMSPLTFPVFDVRSPSEDHSRAFHGQHSSAIGEEVSVFQLPATLAILFLRM